MNTPASTPEETAATMASTAIGKAYENADTDGIMADMARSFDTPLVDAAPSAITPPVVTDKPAKATEKAQEAPVDLGDGFFSDESETPTTPSTEAATDAAESEVLDEAAFDKATDDLTHGMDKKAGEKFRELRASNKEFQKRLAEQSVPEAVQKELAELKLAAEEREGLKAKVQTLSNMSARVKMENSPEYAAEVLEPAGSIFAAADEISESYEGDVKIIRSILVERDRKVQTAMMKEHLSEISEYDRSEVHRLAYDYRKLVEKRDTLLTRSEEVLAELETNRITREKKELADHHRNVQIIQKDVWKKYEDKIPGLLADDGTETEAYKTLRAKGLSIDFTKAKGKDLAFASFAGSLLPFAVTQIKALREQLATYEKSDSNAQRRSPSPSQIIGGNNPSSGMDDDFLTDMAKQRF